MEAVFSYSCVDDRQ